MGNVVSQSLPQEGKNPLKADFEWLTLDLGLVVNDEFVTEQFQKLPEFEGTTVSDDSVKEAEKKTQVDPSIYRMLQILSTTAPCVENVDNVKFFKENESSQSKDMIKMRSRLLQRIHLALIREISRNTSEPEARALHKLIDSPAETDVAAILNAGAIRMILVTMKSVQETNPEVIPEMCETMIELLTESSPLALSRVKPRSAYYQTLDLIASFANDISSSQDIRYHAIALIFAMGVARGCISDIVTASVQLLNASTCPINLEKFSTFKEMTNTSFSRLTDYSPDFPLSPISQIRMIGQFRCKQIQKIEKTSTSSALTTDGVHLFCWQPKTHEISVFGTGFHSTFAGSKIRTSNGILTEIINALNSKNNINSSSNMILSEEKSEVELESKDDSSTNVKIPPKLDPKNFEGPLDGCLAFANNNLFLTIRTVTKVNQIIKINPVTLKLEGIIDVDLPFSDLKNPEDVLLLASPDREEKSEESKDGSPNIPSTDNINLTTIEGVNITSSVSNIQSLLNISTPISLNYSENYNFVINFNQTVDISRIKIVFQHNENISINDVSFFVSTEAQVETENFTEIDCPDEPQEGEEQHDESTLVFSTKCPQTDNENVSRYKNIRLLKFQISSIQPDVQMDGESRFGPIVTTLEVLGKLSSAQKTATEEKKPDELSPILITDGRYLIFLDSHTEKVLNTNEKNSGTLNEEKGENGEQKDEEGKNNDEKEKNKPKKKTTIECVVVDPLDSFKVMSFQSWDWDISTEALRSSMIASNGRNILFCSNKSNNDQNTTYSFRILSFPDGKFLSETEEIFDNKAGPLLNGLTYDRRNNFVWSIQAEPFEFGRWRNIGPIPNFNYPQPADIVNLATSDSALQRIEYVNSLSSQLFETRGSATASKLALTCLSASMMCHLDRLAEPYCAPSTPAAEMNAFFEIELISSSPNDESIPRICVRGQNYATNSKGAHLVVLNEDFIVVDTNCFQLNDSAAANDLFANSIDMVPIGQIVLFASGSNGLSQLNQRGRRALTLIGAGDISNLGGSDSFVIIGWKGAKVGQALQSRSKSENGPAIVTEKIPSRIVPLSIEPSSKLFSSISKLILSNKFLFFEFDKNNEEHLILTSILLSAFRILNTNLFQLVQSTDIAQICQIFSIEHRQELMELLLSVIGQYESCPCKKLAKAALSLFVGSLDIFYPTSAERRSLLVNYLRKFMAEGLSQTETTILERLLRVMSSPQKLNQLLERDSGTGTTPVELLKSLTKIAENQGLSQLDNLVVKENIINTGSTSTLESSLNIGPACLTMLSEVLKRLVSQAIQVIVTTNPIPIKAEKDLKDPKDIAKVNKEKEETKKAEETIQQKTNELFTLVEQVISSCLMLMDKAIQIKHTSNSDGISLEADEILRKSLIGQVLPFVSTTMRLLLDSHGKKLANHLKSFGTAVIPLITKLGAFLVELPLTDLYPESSFSKRSKVITLESEHDYRPNTNESIEISCPGAVRMTLTFDPRTKTENSYDYIRFYKDRNKTISWHPDKDKFCGGPETWPGIGTNPPFVIEGDFAVIQWVTDGSTEYWGWKFDAVCEFKASVVTQTHWLVSLENTICSFASAITTTLIVNTPWYGDVEEQTVKWMNDPLISRGVEDSKLSDSQSQQFLQEIIDRPEGSNGERFVRMMRELVPQDQGSVELINRAVYATCAAIIKHEHLVQQAFSFASGARSEPSAILKKVWVDGQKMRQYFSFGDFSAVLRSLNDNSVPSRTQKKSREPSVYEGADSQVIDKVSQEVVKRVQLLLRIDSNVEKSSSIRQRWASLAKLTHSEPQTNKIDRWEQIVQKTHAANSLRKQLEFRRAAAKRRNETKALTTTERILRFAQSDVDVNDIERVWELRNRRAQLRLEGFKLIEEYVNISESLQSRAIFLQGFFDSLKATRVPNVNRVHYLNGIEGCNEPIHKNLTDSFFAIITSISRTIFDIIYPDGHEENPFQKFLSEKNKLESSLNHFKNKVVPKTVFTMFKTCNIMKSTTVEKNTKQQKLIDDIRAQFITSAVNAYCFDYDIVDHAHLKNSNIISVLKGLLNSTDKRIAQSAWNILELLISRCVVMSGQQIELIEEPSIFAPSLIQLMIQQLQSISIQIDNFWTSCEHVKNQTSQLIPADIPSSSSILLNGGFVHISPNKFGLVSPHIPLGLEHSFSCWIWRKKVGEEKCMSQTQIEVNDRVIQGPDLDSPSVDEYYGTVTAVNDTKVTIRWDSGQVKELRYGEVVRNEEDSSEKKYYDVSIAEEGLGGWIIKKGAKTLLSEEERNKTWSLFGLQILDDACLELSAVAGEDNDMFRIRSKGKIRSEVWTHICVVQMKKSTQIYLDGELNIETEIPSQMKMFEGISTKKIIETPHPYPNNMDNYWEIKVPNAVSYTITFDQRTKTEANYDYIKFYKDNSHTEYFHAEKYCGGRDGSASNWPGINEPPLVINARSFVVYFHSDGSNNDWGFRMFIAATLEKTNEEEGESSEDQSLIQELNTMPIYLGQSPSYIDPMKSIDAFVARPSFFLQSLTTENVNLLSKEIPIEAPVLPEDNLCLTLLTFIQHCFKSPHAQGNELLCSSEVLEALLKLSQRGTFSIRQAALNILALLIPRLSIEIVELHALNLGFKKNINESLLHTLFVDAGRALFMWPSSMTSFVLDGILKISARESNIIGLETLKVIQSIIDSEKWIPFVSQFMNMLNDKAYKLMNSLKTQAEGESLVGQPLDRLQAPVEDLWLIAGFCALLGGTLDDIVIGGRAEIAIGPKDNKIIEQCTILAFTWPPVNKKKTPDESKQSWDWKGIEGFGSAVYISLDSNSEEIILVPLDQLKPIPRENLNGLKCLLSENTEQIIALLKSLIDIRVVDSRPKYLPIVVEQDTEEVIETEHPYPNNFDREWELKFPGADKIIITFDDQCRTENNNDFVKILKAKGSSEYWGCEKYHGRDRDANWPGVGGRSPLEIPASDLVVTFHSDGSENDWGFRLTAKAHTIQKEFPPERLPLLSVAVANSLQFQGFKALSTIIRSQPWVIPLCSPLIHQITDISLISSTNVMTSSKPKPFTLESKHPYDHSEDRYETIEIKAAKKLIISFDPQTNSENNCDYMRLYKDESHTEFWGEQYTGGKDGGQCNWPSIKGRPPLEIPTNRFVLYWHTDGSVNSWGWKIIVTPILNESNLDGLSPNEISLKANHLYQLLYDQPKPQSSPTGLDRFKIDTTVDSLPPIEYLDFSQMNLQFESSENGDNSTSNNKTSQTLSHGQIKQWPKKFVVNSRDTESVSIRDSQSETAPELHVLHSNDEVEALRGEKGWLYVRIEKKVTVTEEVKQGEENTTKQEEKIEEIFGWVQRRQNDRLFLVPKGFNQNLEIIPEKDSPTPTQNHDEKKSIYDIIEAEVPKSMTDTFSSISDDLEGQTKRLMSAMFDISMQGRKKFAQVCVVELLRNWPKQTPISLDIFGSSDKFLHFLVNVFNQEQGQYDNLNNSQVLETMRKCIIHFTQTNTNNARLTRSAIISLALKQLYQIAKSKQSSICSKGIMQVVECKHPYDNNMDQYWTINMAGCKRIVIRFDERSASENNCDYVQVYRGGDRSQLSAINGKDKFTGQPSGGSWPGVNLPLLEVDSDKCEIYFHSDGSNTDWGFKLYAYGVIEEPTKEQREAAKKQKEDVEKANVPFALWLLESLSFDSPEVAKELLSVSSLRILRGYLEAVSDSSAISIVSVSTFLFRYLQKHPCSAESVKELSLFFISLKTLCDNQYKKEAESNAKSSLLSSLIKVVTVGQKILTSPNFKIEFSSLDEEKESNEERESKETENETTSSVVSRITFNSTKEIEVSYQENNSLLSCNSKEKSNKLFSILGSANLPSLKQYQFDVKLIKFAQNGNSPRIGLAKFHHSMQNLNNETYIGNDDAFIGFDNTKFYFGKQSFEHGSQFQENDIMSIEINPLDGTINLLKNYVIFSLAIGNEGSGALVEGNDTKKFLRSVRPVITLEDGMKISISSNDDFKSLIAVGPSFEWLQNIDRLEESLLAVYNRELPTFKVMNDILPKCRNFLQQKSDISNYCENLPFVVPHSSKVEVSFDKETFLAPSDVVIISDEQGREIAELTNLTGGTKVHNSSHQIAIGDLVVRGTSWEWGNEDGGPGCIGEVMELKSWKGKLNCGVVVQWHENGFTSLYRFNYQGSSDLRVIGRGKNSKLNIEVPGNTALISLRKNRTIQQQQSKETLADGWKGAFRFQKSSWITIPFHEKLELAENFTIEAWLFREQHYETIVSCEVHQSPSLNSPVVRTIQPQSFIISTSSPTNDWITVDGGYIVLTDRETNSPALITLNQTRQLIFSRLVCLPEIVTNLELSIDPSNGSLLFKIDDSNSQRLIELSGGTIPVGAWSHIAITFQISNAAIIVNGEEVASIALAEGAMRLPSMGASLCIGGNDIGDFSSFQGMIFDIRCWAVGMSASTISERMYSVQLPNSEGLVGNWLLNSTDDACFFNRVESVPVSVELKDCVFNEYIACPGHKNDQSTILKVNVIPVFHTLEDAKMIPELKHGLDTLCSMYCVGELKHDIALAHYVNEAARRNKDLNDTQLLASKWEDMSPSETDLTRKPLVRELMEKGKYKKSQLVDIWSEKAQEEKTDNPNNEESDEKSDDAQENKNKVILLPAVAARFEILLDLNRLVRDVVYFIDFGSIDESGTVAHLLSIMRELIFFPIKRPLWDSALQTTERSGSEFELKFNRPRASKFILSGAVDHEGRYTTFSQAFRAMNTMSVSSFRRSTKLYKANFMGEYSIDAGGPYRESFSTYCQELQSNALPLLIRTPNAQHAIGQNREKWMLNPSSTFPTHMEMFTFLGKLLGMCIRTKEYLALNLPSFVWKKLVGQKVTLEDLEGIDMMLTKSLNDIRTIDQQGVTADMFEDVLEETFTTLSSDNREVELLPEGSKKPLTFENRYEYCNLVEKYRLHEIDAQAEAIRKGLNMIVPYRLLSLFSWNDLEVMVCGVPDFDVNLLRSVTEYSGLNEDDQNVRFFWDALRDFTNEERSMFLRFTWGRSRLPLSADSFPQRFKLQNFGRSPADNFLPVSHTCFFSLELPNYSSLDIMKTKLRYAIYNCTSIDGDSSMSMDVAAADWS